MDQEYGIKLAEAMQLLSKRSEMIQGQAAAQEYERAAVLMGYLTANLHTALPEQRAVAFKLIMMGLEGIDKAEAQ